MPRRAKGPRLWLRPARRDAKRRLTHPATWYVLDRASQHSTGLGVGATEKQKDDALRAYLTDKHTIAATTDKRDPAGILIADVLALYARDVAPKHARPEETAARLENIAKFKGWTWLSDVSGAACRRYAKERGSGARRDLEDFRSAINYHRNEGLHDKIVSVVLPDKPEPRERWLTRSEAAHLILTAWRYRERQQGEATVRYPRRHVAKFMVVARYMGSRASIICAASIESKRPAGKPWVDLTSGIFYGKPAGQRATKKRKQLVRIPPPLLAHLRRWRKRGQRYAVEYNGKPVTRVTKGHNAAVKAAGLGTDVTPHTWRHSLATWLMQNNPNHKASADFLAMSLETFMRVYGHHDPSRFTDVYTAMRARPV